MRHLQALLLLSLIALAGTVSAYSIASPHRNLHVDKRSPLIAGSLLAAKDRERQCGEQARDAFHRLGWDSDPLARLVSHYGKQRKRCFVEIDKIIQDSRYVEIFRSLSDSTGREYANYVSVAQSGVGANRTSMVLCEFMLRSGEVFECQSSSDFELIINEYMK